MKKIFLLVIIAAVLGGCYYFFFRSTPQKTVKEFIQALQDDNAAEALSLCCDFEGNPLETDGVGSAGTKMFSTVSAMISGQEFEVKGADYSDDGETAKVIVATKILGKEVTTPIKCRKGTDGKWYVSL